MMHAAGMVEEEIRAEEQFGVQLMDYAGQWVAVRGREVFCHADTLDALLELTRGHEQDITIVQVPKHPDAVCFY